MRASNRDGFWDRDGVVYQVTQRLYFYQTNAFQLSAVFAIGFMLFAGYRFRIRQVAAEMNVRFEERLNERTRIAREVHDTLLQTIQGSKFVADEALDENADLLHVRKALVRLSGWLGQAIQEGRAVLSALRASTLEGNNLAEALQRILVECQLQHPIACDLTVEGSSREMHPIVRDEIYRIAYEAIRNACMHSGGKHVKVELWYRRDLTVRVRDDGHGMDSSTVTTGKESHFGIVGMYERATGIGATVTLTSSPGNPTQVELIVPGHIVFEQPSLMRAWIAKIRRL
jgi:signal transduction histidine kinase